MRDQAELRGVRLLLSTHNPALMDALPDSALGDVVFCYRDSLDGDSRLVRLADLEDYAGLVSQGPLGELVTNGIVDRFVKSPVTVEQKRQNALAWLQSMQGDSTGQQIKQIHPSIDLHNNRTLRNDRRVRVDV
jgi:hypothetical protein